MKPILLFTVGMLVIASSVYSQSTADCQTPTASAYLEISNVRALIMNGADMWWDLQGTSKYEVPKNSGKNSLFAGALWVGGIDANGLLHLSAERFRQDGNDYWPGPLKETGADAGTTNKDECLLYDKIYSIYRQDVKNFRAWYNASPSVKATDFPGYVVPQSITEWPAHGNLAEGYPYYLAPFYDNNSDGIYNPTDGDYPYFDLDGTAPCGGIPGSNHAMLNGDESLWWIFNDYGTHTESGGNALGFEYRAQAYAFVTSDEDINNATFYNYIVSNRSSNTYQNLYAGMWTDADLGDATDDYIGCDVDRGLGYLYNGDSNDGSGQTYAYGENPPAIGIDFLQGPYKDADGTDDLRNRDNNGNLDCSNGYRYNSVSGQFEVAGSGDIMNGNINGQNYGDGVIDNERWGMTHYAYFNNPPYGSIATQDPHTASDHYNYLINVWKDGTHFKYGGTGHTSDLNATDISSNFAFSGNTDFCNYATNGTDAASVLGYYWSEYNENYSPGDRRFIVSSGPITVEPGGVFDFTFAAVWARGHSDNLSSVTALQNADDKIQQLFDNCFHLLELPDAPELEITEGNQSLSIKIKNLASSNNYNESYIKQDPTISCVTCDKNYRFQGYKVFQVKNNDVTVDDLKDTSKARLVYQCDLADTVSNILNYYWSYGSQQFESEEMVTAANQGKNLTFSVTHDAFSVENQLLTNHKTYYFIAVAYAYNNYQPFSQQGTGQRIRYIESKVRAMGQIQPFPGMPHEANTTNQALYGAEPEITQYDGYGGGYNYIELTEETENKIMSSPNWKADTLVYKAGKGPVKIRAIDPLNIPQGNYMLKMDTVSINTNIGHYYYNYYFIDDTLNYDANGYICDTKWILVDMDNNATFDTIYSDNWVSMDDIQVIPQLGVSVEFVQTPYPFPHETWPGQPYSATFNPKNNGLVGSSVKYSDNSKPWLKFMGDSDLHSFMDWVKAGTDYTNPGSGDCNVMYNDRKLPGTDTWMDPDEKYETMANEGWGPYRLVSSYIDAPAEASSLTLIKSREERLANVDIVITSDKTKWTRCPVLETTDNDYDIDGDGCAVMSSTVNSTSYNNALKLDLRKSPSVDQDGNPDGSGTTGMGWFPGYAIDVETGERLNMMFGESSYLTGDNGCDMKWNPSGELATDLWYNSGGTAGQVLMGGKHFIYVMGHNIKFNTSTKKFFELMKEYDEGDTLRVMLDSLTPHANYKRSAFMQCMWVGVPYVDSSFDFLATDVKIQLRVVSPYRRRIGQMALANSPNGGYPMYSFNTSTFAVGSQSPIAKSKKISGIIVYPNPSDGLFTLRLEGDAAGYNGNKDNKGNKATYSIYTLQGQKIKSGELLDSQQSIVINRKGVYIVVVVTKNDSFSERIIVTD